MAQTAQININVNAKQATDTVGQLNAELNQTTKSFNSMKAELRAVTQELQGLDPGSARFKELSTRAGQLRDTISDTNQVINATAGNLTENFGRALGSSVQLGVAGFQGLLSVQTLFGVENENLQKTLNQFGALLNLTQAIETFGGLSDKLTQIKAGFTPVLQALGLMATTQTEVAVSTGAATVAIEGEAIASTEAAGATTFFGAALNALPIIAIATAIGLLVAGLISYSNSSSEAAKKEKERKENLENLKKQQEENRKAQEQENTAVASASKEYVGLIVNLKNTVAGSRERQKQINEINATYGTTLKNISDEYKFQEQLNQSVRDYIAVQVLRIRQDQNLDKIVKSIQAEETALKKYYGALAQAKKDAKLFNVTFEEFRKGIYTSNDALTAAEIALTQAQLKTQALTLTSEELAKEELKLTNNGKQFGDVTKNNTDAIDKNNEALQRQKDALSNLQSLYARQIDAEKQLEVFERGLMTISSSMMILDEDGNQIAQSSLSRTGKYFQDIFEIEQGFRDKQNALLEQATQRELEKYEESILGKKVSEKDYYDARKKIIDEGENYLIESEQLLMYFYGKESEKQVKRYIDEQELKTNIANDTTNKINADISLLNLQFAKEQRIKDVENAQLTEEEKNKEILQIRKDFLDQEIYLIEFNAKRQKDILDSQKELDILNAENNSAEILLIEKKYNKDLLDLTQSTQTQIQDLTTETTEVQKTQVEKLTESLNKVDDILGAIQDVYSQFESAITNLTAANTEKRTQLIEDAANEQMAILDSQLQQRLITEEEYNNQKTQLEQEQAQQSKALAKKEFETNKKLNIVSATIDGARAVLSTFANTPGGLILQTIAAGLAAAFAAIQIGVIKNSVFTAATGGIVPGSGSGDIDSVPANLAPGEAVINSRSTSRFLPVLSAINMAEGGRSLMPNLPSVNQGQTFQTVYASNQPQQPIRAYVVESDVSDAQRRVQRIENSTRF